ncbi:MAG: alanine--tRNA ligase [Chthonomonadaceae bacterium]|nr:alanine--tRNA ligase [Chthonomonadaceae bacterium]
MKPLTAHELRQKYIDFFVGKGHLHLPGSPLTPIDVLGNPDPSTLFTTAGMQQFKPYFTGAATPPSGRICTVQKCLRTTDIDSVGDFSHCTFFEMLGNFSFGDYFKAEVIPWTWEFLTEWLEIDPDRLCVTVFQDDEEAFAIWRDVVGLPEDRIHRLGADKNFWPANAILEGPNGPCGPCSEVFYRLAAPGEMTTDPDLTPTQRYLQDDAAGRWLEIWNNVFTQFDRQEDAQGQPVLVPLPRKNNDTGAGLDRIAYVLQGQTSVFETDLFRPTLAHLEALSGKQYTGTLAPVDFAFRCVAEHTRAMTFCIADGILPSNEGAGYVLRYIMRRAVRYGTLVLGFDRPFLHEVAPKIIEQMGDFYGELRERQDLILHTIQDEEERFRRTLDSGMNRFMALIGSPQVQETRQLSGQDAFTLYATYGFPIGLTRDLAAENGITVDMAAFEQEMQRHRQVSATGEREVFLDYNAAIAQIQSQHPPTEFVGYTQLATEARVLAILRNGTLVGEAQAGPEPVEVVLDRTPFYAEAGGQVGDTGVLRFPESRTRFSVRVLDTRKIGGYFLHTVHIDDDVLRVGQEVYAEVDAERRRSIMRNHTATHLLQAALRQVLGNHVHQKGSLVAPDRLRFDFTHTQPVSQEELRQIEQIVNEQILRDEPVRVHADVPLAEARARGAMALFGEKYSEHVRMIEIPGFSLELCGGTHLTHTAQAGLFKILSETGVAAGVRRIEAVTGKAAWEHVARQEDLLLQTAALLRTGPNNLPAAVERLLVQRRELEAEIRKLRSASGTARSLDFTPRQVEGIAVIAQAVPDVDAETLASLVDSAAQKLESGVVVLGTASNGKVALAARITRDLIAQGLHAGHLIRDVAKITGGGGGGRPDFAQAGGRDPERLQEALDAVPGLVAAQRRS